MKYRDIYSGLRRRGDDVDELLWGDSFALVTDNMLFNVLKSCILHAYFD